MTAASVVIPTYERADGLRSVLLALARQTAPADRFEVVVVDDGSGHATASMLAAIDVPYRLVVERQENAGPAAARNRGIAAASGRWCIFIDDDILADPGLVAGHIEAQEQAGGMVGIGGLRLRAAGRRGGLAAYFADWWAEHYRRLEEGEQEPDFWGGFSGNLSAPRETLLAVGGFDEELDRSEDVELAYRLEETGLEIGFVHGAGGEQVHAKGFREIVRDFDRAGAAAVALWRKHPAMVDHAPLGDFSQGGARAILARRLLLALRAPVWPLAIVDPLLAGRPSPRLYQFLQLHCFWRSLRPALGDRETWARLTRGPVILRYRALAAAGEPPSRYVIPEGRFRRQLAWMRLRQRPILSLDEYVDLRMQRRLPPARAVIVTFDDGYADVARAAAPSLRRAGAPATMFVVTGSAGGSNDWAHSGPVSGRELLSWDGIRRLVKAGFTVGSHAIEHIDLTALDITSARRQISGAAEELDRRVHPGMRILSYPYGRSNESVRQAAADLGFAGAVGMTPGPNGPAVPLHDLRRMEVWGTRPLHRFILDLWLGVHFGSPDRTGQPGG